MRSKYRTKLLRKSWNKHTKKIGNANYNQKRLEYLEHAWEISNISSYSWLQKGRSKVKEADDTKHRTVRCRPSAAHTHTHISRSNRNATCGRQRRLMDKHKTRGDERPLLGFGGPLESGCTKCLILDSMAWPIRQIDSWKFTIYLNFT